MSDEPAIPSSVEHVELLVPESAALRPRAGGTTRHKAPGSGRPSPGAAAVDRVNAAVAARRTALADVWLALWTSRLVVFLAGLYGVLTLGFQPPGGRPHKGTPWGHLGELLFAPAQRWDGGFYVQIAVNGYHRAVLGAFFPFYPLTVRWLNVVLATPLVAAIIVSLASFAVALYLLHRLVTLELGGEHARTAVLVLAFFPTALFFSMAYPEALLLALAIGAVYAARTGHWGWAAILGALASATHSDGVLVAIPIALLYLYGPRADREPLLAAPVSRWRPRYPLRLDILWVLLVPLGLLAFFGYMDVEYGDALRPLHLNETIWHRHFEFLGGITGIVGAVGHSLHTIASVRPAGLFPGTNRVAREAGANILDAAMLVLALAATIGVIRRLPFAYSAYTVITLVLLVSAPISGQPLVSLPRYILLLFPLYMSIALWLDRRGRAGIWLGCSGMALGALSMNFAIGGWVA
ncbi:MAG TPA: mannosyltransferase family protein [Solirubrobacteraceae bacterium]|nr:mannosyltransferase family protein [Solirubrobacteraceae bacterium]